MIDTIKKWIEEADTIVIHRHKDPDYDALGSQWGLKYLIQDNYPEKNVYVLEKTINLKRYLRWMKLMIPFFHMR